MEDTIYNIITNSLAVFNVMFALLLVYVHTKGIIRFRGRGINTMWVRVIQVVIGLYWAGVYAFVLVTKPGEIDPILFGQIFVRPAFTFSLGAMVAIAIWRAKYE